MADLLIFEVKRSVARRHDIKQNDIQPNDIYPNLRSTSPINEPRFSLTFMLSVAFFIVMPTVVILNVVTLSVVAPVVKFKVAIIKA